jgi:nitrite reductase/ring-hydroxylating ferredoxin subunit
LPRITLKKSDIPDNGATVVKVNNWLKVAIFRVGDRLAAIDNRCPHAGADLWDGEDSVFNGVTVRCPWHGYRVDVWKGQGLDGAPHPTFPVALDGDEVQLTVPDEVG